MRHYAGLDASKNSTSVCILDSRNEVVAENVVETTPQAILAALLEYPYKYHRVGIESMSMTPWLYEPISEKGIPIICIESRHARSVLQNRLNKTDRNDARGIAEMMRAGIYKTVHIKTASSREGRLLLSTRRLLVLKLRDMDNFVRSSLLQEGYKLRSGQQYSFESRAAESAPAGCRIGDMVDLLLEARRVMARLLKELDKQLEAHVQQDRVCVRLMTAPGVGPVTALSYRVAIDVPQRFARSSDVGVHLGLTPAAFRSGTIDRRGRISKCGDRDARAALFLAARSILRKNTKNHHLKTWGFEIAARRGYAKAAVAVARRLAVTLHRMWINERNFEDLTPG